MSKKYASLELFQINQSQLLVNWLVVLHVIAIIATFLNALELTYKVIIVTLVLMSLYVCIKREIDSNSCSLRYSKSYGWEVAFIENLFYPVAILPTTIITPYLLILHIKIQNQQKRTILICKDALNNSEFRKLMVLLKISGLPKDD